MKIKGIPLRGLGSTASDYDCSDGELHVAHNSVNDGSGLAALQDVEALATIDGYALDSGEEFGGLVFVHKTSMGDRYIGSGSDGCLYAYVGKTMFPGSSHDYVPTFYYWQKMPFVSDGLFVDGKYQISAVGNVLVVSIGPADEIDGHGTLEGLHYLRYMASTDSYSYLGQRPPDVGLEFKLGKYTGKIMDVAAGGWSASKEKLPSEFFIPLATLDDSVSFYRETTIYNKDSKDFCEDNPDSIFAVVNRVETKLKEKELYAHPFLVRYAYKLYDGSYMMHSSPVLMVPADNKLPLVCLCKETGQARQDVYVSTMFTKTTLQTMASNRSDDLKQWSDIVDKICVFITPAIWLYEDGGNLTQRNHGENGGGIIHSLSSATNDIETLSVPHYNWQYEINSTTDSTPVLYEASFTYSGTGLKERILSAGENFYLLREYSIDEVLNLDDFARVISGKAEGIRDLKTFERLPDGYRTTSTYISKYLHTYNGRLNIGNISLKENPTFPKGYIGQYIPNGAVEQEVCVYIDEDGTINKASVDGVWSRTDFITGYFSYSNPKAKCLSIKSGNSTRYFLMQRHPYMHASYSFGSEIFVPNEILKPQIVYAYEQKGVNSTIHQTNYMYTSAVDNPFVFPAVGVNAVGNGEILAIESATKAVSEGTAFGSVPLYAFCTDGIWALSVNGEGVFAAKQPVSREVPLRTCAGSAGNGGSVLGIDNSVVFLCERGLMQLSGQETRLMSEDLGGWFGTLDLVDLPGWEDIHAALGYGEPDGRTALEADDFLEFIRGARLAFDYAGYRIWVYRRGKAFVLSLKSGAWSTCDCSFKSSVSGWPGTLVNFEPAETIGENSTLAVGEFSVLTERLVGDGKCFWVTRPLKLEEPDVLKTVRTLVERGRWSYENREEKALCLWGSRDLTNWHMIKNVWKGTRISGMSGSPYKYFIVGGWAKMGVHGDVTSRLDVEFVDKFANRIR